MLSDQEYNSLYDDTDISPNNPYVFNSNFNNLNGNNNNIKTIKIQDSVYLHIPDKLLYKAIAIEHKLFAIKLICLFDYVINLCFFMNGYKYGLIISGISLTGYLSTVYHKKYLFLFYLLYQYLLCFSKFTTVLFFIYLIDNDDLKNKLQNDKNDIIPYEINNETDFQFLIFISFLFFLIQLYITKYCRSYYILIPSKKEQSQIFLTFDELI